MPERGTDTTSFYRGPDAYSTQRDMWDVQQRSVPQADQFFLTSTDSPLVWGTGSSSGSNAADTWYLTPLSPLSRDFTPAQMRLRISTLALNSHIDVAVFVQIHEPDGPTLHVVPQLYLEFEASTAGVKTVNVQEGPNGELPVLRTENHYWLGYNADSAVLRFVAVDTNQTPVIGFREIPYSHESAHSLRLAATASSLQNHFPFIVMLSKRAAEIF